MDTLESESTMPISMNTATLWNNRLADLFIDWKVFIILTEIKLITGLKILSSEIRESMIKLKQIADIKRIQIPLDLTNPGALNRGLKDTEEGNFAKGMPPALIILNKQTMIFVGRNFAIALDNINPVFWGITKR